jgi:hypothetical protein
MAKSLRRRTWPVAAAVALAGLLLTAAAVQGWIRLAVSAAAHDAERRFGQGRVDSLLRVVDCETCGLRTRERAVWALGELGDGRAVPALRAHLSGHKCDHDRGLCQYELNKAIRKLERTWSVVQKAGLQAGRDYFLPWRTCSKYFSTYPCSATGTSSRLISAPLSPCVARRAS